MDFVKIILCLPGLFLPFCLNAQGCSDAGFCTINSLTPTATIPAKSNEIKAGFSIGSADNNITATGIFMEYGRILTDRFSIDGKLTALGQSGNGIAAFGLSDIYLNAKYEIHNGFGITLGAKLPLNNGNRSKGNRSLPMDYQSSLGTLDIITGLSYTIKNLQLVAAVQQPLTSNSNAFLSEQYAAGNPLSTFQSTNNFKRSGDVLLRLSYPFRLSRQLRLTPSVLPIYHLKEDKFTDAAGQERNIAGSSGLTLNGNAYVDYSINEVHGLQLSAGMPFITRKSRPDGLTRHFIAAVRYSFSF